MSKQQFRDSWTGIIAMWIWIITSFSFIGVGVIGVGTNIINGDFFNTFIVIFLVGFFSLMISLFFVEDDTHG